MSIKERIDNNIDKLRPLVYEATDNAIKNSLDNMLHNSLFYGYECLGYDDYTRIYNNLMGDISLFFYDFLANCNFLEEVDSHENSLKFIIQQEVYKALSNVTFEEQLINDEISKRMLDCDYILASDEEAPFGSNSEFAKEQKMNENQECIQRCLDKLAHSLSEYFIENKLYKTTILNN